MRDYKNVKVPRQYRSGAARVSVKRVAVSRSGRGGARPAVGAKAVLLNILAFGLLAACSWLAWQTYGFITRADLFQISGVDVRGVHELDNAELREIVGPFTGQNIFKADLETAARRARLNPWVREARIHRSLPNRITMDIVERVPRAVVISEGVRYLMDGDTVVLERCARPERTERKLPAIVIRDARPRPGETVASESVNDALMLLAEIEARGGWNLAEVTVKAGSPEALSIAYADHEFKIGSGRYAEKLRRLAEVMADVQQRGLNIAYVDLRSENQAAVMARESSKNKAPQTRHQSTKKNQ